MRLDTDGWRAKFHLGEEIGDGGLNTDSCLQILYCNIFHSEESISSNIYISQIYHGDSANIIGLNL